MFGRKKQPQISKEDLALYENAKRRIRQKKRLQAHAVVFVIGAIFLVVASQLLKIGENLTFFGYNWVIYAILIWVAMLLYHLVSVFITNRFMGKEWEDEQTAILIAKQKARIEALAKKVEADQPLQLKATLKAQTVTIIAAADENNAIGKDNQLIWHLSEDLKRFKTLTNGHHIIMGRKTFESFPKPLPNRTHIVISRQRDYKVPKGVIVVNNLLDALDAAKSDDRPYIIGGGEIYKQAMEFADVIELTKVHHRFENADTYFPEIDTAVWQIVNNQKFEIDERHDYPYSFITYKRK
ncbi:dihydrofolate reductase [Paucihalobacter ruber]|uniref:dihydrofolate reductase n=1 Tax=Paucihalobacter ruber TaxID=2567861 RepID=A0A506PU87_9FLAO|nr:dihydrofolate reductase [Paucihalobacter ruber]TPV35790.1 dihydrofolate reductase [Paucihalobacter ruber]